MQVFDLTGDHPLLTYRVVVPGKPMAMPRPRVHWARRFLYNPASNKVAALRAFVRASIPATQYGVVFPTGVSVTVTITFHMRRPDIDFRRGDRVGAVLKATAPVMRPISPDIDNLAKFILDGLNGVLYSDDRQVVKLVTMKLLDNEGQCNGRTVVEVSEFDPMSLL